MKIGYLNTIQRIPIKNACTGYYLRWWYNGWHYWFFFPGQVRTRSEGEKYFTLGTQILLMGSGQVTYEQSVAIRTIKNSREIYLLTDPGWMNVRLEHGSVVVKDNQVDGYEIDLTVIVGSRTISLTGYSPIILPDVDPPNPDPDILVTTCIGTQQWMTKNYDSVYPGSRVYNDDEANRAIYGGLYTQFQIMDSGFCPVGYHVPTLLEWNQLITFAGGTSIAGQVLKEAGILHWLTGGGTDALNFTALGGGAFNIFTNSFQYLNEVGYFRTSTSGNMGRSYVAQLNLTAECTTFEVEDTHYMPVRLVKDAPCGVYQGYGALYNWFAAAGII
jgi:uncharacterized protein (TIGR02145 family)